MSDNPQYGTERVFDLSGIRVLALTGCDAVAFAQSQFMNDVAALADGQWQWSGWLDAKGRVLALFAVLRRDAETLWLLTSADVEGLAGSLRRFVFRSRVRLEAVAQPVSGRLAMPAVARGSRLAVVDGSVELDLSGEGGPRALRIGQPAAPADEALSRAWEALDLAHGWPALPAVRLDAWTPQQLSLQRLQALSVKKGCYPGQEIVARTHFLGRAKRGLARFALTAGVEGQPAVQDREGRDVGQVVVARGLEALAVVPLDVDAAGFVLSGQPLAPLPLAAGLER